MIQKNNRLAGFDMSSADFIFYVRTLHNNRSEYDRIFAGRVVR